MAAPSRADVADLNERAREHLRADHQLGAVAADIAGLELRVGDRVIAHRNRYDLGIMNGDTGRVSSADDRYVYVALDDHRRMRVPYDYVADGLLTHAYATTVHKAQGMTCDATFLLGDDGLYAELGYTGLSRGRDTNRLYAVAEHVVDVSEHGRSDREDRFLGAASAFEPEELAVEIAGLVASGTPRRLDERGLQPRRALPCACRAALAGAFI